MKLNNIHIIVFFGILFLVFAINYSLNTKENLSNNKKSKQFNEFKDFTNDPNDDFKIEATTSQFYCLDNKCKNNYVFWLNSGQYNKYRDCVNKCFSDSNSKTVFG